MRNLVPAALALVLCTALAALLLAGARHARAARPTDVTTIESVDMYGVCVVTPATRLVEALRCVRYSLDEHNAVMIELADEDAS